MENVISVILEAIKHVVQYIMVNYVTAAAACSQQEAIKD